MKGKALVIGAVVAFLGLFAAPFSFLLLFAGSPNASAAACSTFVSTAENGNAPSNASLIDAIKVGTAGNSRLALSMLTGSYLESKWVNIAVGAGSFGPYQIQNPGVLHPDITVAEAQNPAAATNYMLPFYRRALASLPEARWLNAMMAAHDVAFRAERPKYPYIVSRGQDDVIEAYQASIQAMQQNGMSVDFGPRSDIELPASSPGPVTSSADSAGCATNLSPEGTLVDPGPGPQNRNAKGLLFNLAPRTVNLIGYVQKNWDCAVKEQPACVHGYGGWRPTDAVPDHPQGVAVDFTISTQLGTAPEPAELVFGWGMACFFQAHADELGIEYVIWQGRIWNTRRPNEGGPGGCGGNTKGWRDYCTAGNCGPYGSGATLTEGHYDHIHVTMRRD